VAKLAELSLSFGRPVLLLNGDTHLYHYDQPMADPNSVTGKIYNTPAVPNLTRIVVQGSLPSVGPSEWLRLTIDPRSAKVFSWDNVVYCTNPLTSSCQ
jgi:CO dehydrogenase/acetyl-CoA synthase delta subunit